MQIDQRLKEIEHREKEIDNRQKEFHNLQKEIDNRQKELNNLQKEIEHLIKQNENELLEAFKQYWFPMTFHGSIWKGRAEEALNFGDIDRAVAILTIVEENEAVLSKAFAMVVCVSSFFSSKFR